MNEEMVAEIGYSPAKQLATGEWAGIQNMIFTVGLFVGITDMGYRTRFCYPNRQEAEAALKAWDGKGDPPGPWIKQKPENRNNPRSLCTGRIDETNQG